METQQLAEYANLLLNWIGFGTLIGLLVTAIVPSRDGGGAVANLLMAIAGTLIGCAVLMYFYPNTTVKPISVPGFTVGAGGALVMLTFYRVLGGASYMGRESSSFRHRRRRRKVLPEILED